MICLMSMCFSSVLFLFYQQPDFAKVASKADEREFNNPITAIAVSPDGMVCVIGFENGEIETVSASSLKPLNKFRGHEGKVTDLSYLPNGEILSSGIDGFVIRWSPTGDGLFELREKFKSIDQGYLTNLVVTSEGNWAVRSTEHVLFPIGTGKLAPAFEFEWNRGLISFSLSKDKKLLVVSKSANEVGVFHLDEFTATHKCDLLIPHDHAFQVSRLAFNESADKLMCVTSDRMSSRLWIANLNDGEISEASFQNWESRYPHLISDAAFSADGRNVFLVTRSNIVIVNVETLSPVIRLDTGNYMLNRIAIFQPSPKSFRIFASGPDGQLFTMGWTQTAQSAETQNVQHKEKNENGRPQPPRNLAWNPHFGHEAGPKR